jgi:hypothetical protein
MLENQSVALLNDASFSLNCILNSEFPLFEILKFLLSAEPLASLFSGRSLYLVKFSTKLLNLWNVREILMIFKHFSALNALDRILHQISMQP